MSKTPKTVLKDAREFLTEPKRWIKGDLFQNGKGEAVTRPAATCACLTGALLIGSGGTATPERRDAFDGSVKLLEALTSETLLADFNDRPTTTHADVLAVLDKAIENA